MRNRTRIALTTLIVLIPALAAADVPHRLTYQGILLDPNGAPQNGNADLVLRIYDDPISVDPAALLYQEAHPGTLVVDGVFSVVIGEGSSASGPFDASIFAGPHSYPWLEVEVEEQILTPRQPFTSVAYAMHSQMCVESDFLNGQTAADIIILARDGLLDEPQVDSLISGHAAIPDAHHAKTSSFAELVDTATEAQIPTAVARDAEIMPTVLANDGPASGLDADRLDGLDSGAFLSTVSDFGRSGVASDLYEGTQTLTTRYVNAVGPDNVSGSASGPMLQGLNTGAGAGLRGSSQSDHGTIGYTDAGDKGGVFGNNTSGYGVWGNSVSGHAVFGQSTNGRGVKGVSPGGGVYGESTLGVGVEGKSNTTDGVVGVTLASDKSGVFGRSDSGIGVTGRSAGASGVLGVTTSTDPGDAGVTARNEGSALALRAEGDVFVAGGAYRGDLGPGGGAPFPRPAWDSGWVAINPGQNVVLSHTVGGNVDDYVVDFQQKQIDATNAIGIHNKWSGGEHYYASSLGHFYYGAYWHDLKPYEISVERFADDSRTHQFRIRIWVVR